MNDVAVKKINPNLNYKGEITSDELSKSMHAKKWDCYLFTGPREYEVFDDIVLKGDLIYSLGEIGRWKSIRLLGEEVKTEQNANYDVCIIGGGAGGVAAAYALKDSGLSVCLVEQLDSLGGTHINSGVFQILASPAPDFFKEICEDFSKTDYFKWEGFSYSVGSDEESDFEKLWRGSCINYGRHEWGNFFNINPILMQNRYLKDLSEKIDIRLNRKFICQHSVDGVIENITVENLLNGKEERIYADYFIDASGNGDLCRYGKTLDQDFFLGADPKSLYSERAIADGFEGDHYELNSMEPTYYIREIAGNPIVFDKPDFKEVEGIVNAVNNSWKYPTNAGITNQSATWLDLGDGKEEGTYYTSLTVVSPDKHANLSAADYINHGYDYVYNKGKNNAKAHFNARFPNGECQYLGVTKLLAIRETYRIKCDRMLTQDDVETLATAENVVDNHCIALASWYCDMHFPVSVTKTDVQFRQLFGIPYECIIPSAYKNVLVGCKAFGASHVAVSSSRLTKTIMCIGYSAGKAIEQARKEWLEDVRKVDVAKLQADCGVLSQIADFEKYFDLK